MQQKQHEGSRDREGRVTFCSRPFMGEGTRISCLGQEKTVHRQCSWEGRHLIQEEIRIQDRDGEGADCVWGTRRGRLYERREQNTRQESGCEGHRDPLRVSMKLSIGHPNLLAITASLCLEMN